MGGGGGLWGLNRSVKGYRNNLWIPQSYVPLHEIRPQHILLSDYLRSLEERLCWGGGGGRNWTNEDGKKKAGVSSNILLLLYNVDIFAVFLHSAAHSGSSRQQSDL